jgi:hypothetical protein
MQGYFQQKKKKKIKLNHSYFSMINKSLKKKIFKHSLLLFLILLANTSFSQTTTQVVLTETQADATVGLDRKDFLNTGIPSDHSEGYAHDFTLPEAENDCQSITGVSIQVVVSGFTNNSSCAHSTLFYNLYYGCGSYSGGASCSPGTNLLAEPNFAPGSNSPLFNFGNPFGSPSNGNLVPEFGGNLSVDLVPVTQPGCNGISNGISYQYTITVTVTIQEDSEETPIFDSIDPICSGETLNPLPTTSNNGITGTWSPVLNNANTTTYTFTPDDTECAETVEVEIEVTAPVTPQFSFPTEINQGDIIELPILSNNNIEGSWSPAFNNTSTTLYTFTPINSECSEVVEIEIVVLEPTSPQLTVGDDVTLCIGEEINFEAFGVAEVIWTSNPIDASLTSTGDLSASASPEVTTTYIATSTSEEEIDLIYNGNFSLGNEGFLSDYQFLEANPEGTQGAYGVVQNSNTWFFAFAQCTAQSGQNYFVADGAITPNQRIWCQTLNVNPGQDYNFSYFIQSVVAQDNNPANIEVQINGELIGVDSAPSTGCNWVERNYSWNSGTNNTIEICLVNTVTESDGNDFGIDNIRFTTTQITTEEASFIAFVEDCDCPEFNNNSGNQAVCISGQPNDINFTLESETNNETVDFVYF